MKYFNLQPTKIVSVTKAIREYPLVRFHAALVSSKLFSSDISEDAGRDLYKINTRQLIEIAGYLNRSSQEVNEQEQIAYVCSSGFLSLESCVSVWQD